MQAFVTGATGYIGFNVACALRRAGYKVWGLTRSEEKAGWLKRNEIHPVIGDMQRPESYEETAEQCSVLVHAAADYEHDTPKLDQRTVKTLINTGRHGAQPKTFIYTSGCWVIGNTGRQSVNETTPLNPIEAVEWRPDIEEQVLDSDIVNGLVVRPGCVYGERGGLTGMWFEAAESGNLTAVGDGSNFWTMVHVADLADAYVRLADSGLMGEVFNVSDYSRWKVSEMVEAVARATDYQGEISYVPVEQAADQYGPMAEALALNQHVNPNKAVSRLGWLPRARSFVDDIDSYYASWKAWQA